MGSQQHRTLARQCAENYERFLLSSLPRIAEAMNSDAGSASFTVTAQFRTKKDETMVVDLKPRERVPLEPVELKVQLKNGQLSLFEGAEA